MRLHMSETVKESYKRMVAFYMTESQAHYQLSYMSIS